MGTEAPGWLRSGRRIKGEWVAMLDAARRRSREAVKLPFVPLKVSGATLRAVLEDMLPVLLGENPSLLTVITEGGDTLKAYAEDASSGVYEKLVPLEVEPRAGRAALVDLARRSGVIVGVVKEAETSFFDLFAEEPADLAEAVARLVSGVAKSLREGSLRFEPEPAVAELARRIDLGPETLSALLASALPDGRYGVGFACSTGAGALVLDVKTKVKTKVKTTVNAKVNAQGNTQAEAKTCAWKAEEVEVGSSGPGDLARELVERHGCGFGIALALPALGRLLRGELSAAEFVRARDSFWAVRTRSGLEAAIAALPWAIEFLGAERDLEECNIGIESIVKLLRGYIDSARSYAREKGVGVKVTGGGEPVALTWDAEGLHERESDEPLEVDLALVRRGISLLAGDPLARLKRLVPREVMDHAGYATAVVLVECGGPEGRLLLFGGPHDFFDRAWEGDSCAVLIDERGIVRVSERPARPLEIAGKGRAVSFRGDGFDVDLRFEHVRARTDLHGAGRFVGSEHLAGLLPGLEVARTLLELASGKVRIDGRELALGRGWMYLEEGRGKLLRWPFGSTWVYSSWLRADGECGSGVRAAPMLGGALPPWLARIVHDSTDGAARVHPTGDEFTTYEAAVDPGPPVRVVRDCARAGGTELRYRVLSAAAVPFDEDGQVIFRLRCLTERGAGLVEIPASFPGQRLAADACRVVFDEDAIYFRVAGRELLTVEQEAVALSGAAPGARFLEPYRPPAPGLWGRIARALRGR